MSKDFEEEQVLSLVNEATGLEMRDPILAVTLFISQRDNARHYVKTFRKKFKALGHEFV